MLINGISCGDAKKCVACDNGFDVELDNNCGGLSVNACKL